MKDESNQIDSKSNIKIKPTKASQATQTSSNHFSKCSQETQTQEGTETKVTKVQTPREPQWGVFPESSNTVSNFYQGLSLPIINSPSLRGGGEAPQSSTTPLQEPVQTVELRSLQLRLANCQEELSLTSEKLKQIIQEKFEASTKRQEAEVELEYLKTSHQENVKAKIESKVKVEALEKENSQLINKIESLKESNQELTLSVGELQGTLIKQASKVTL